MLKNSARNCRLVFSVMVVFLKSEKSTSASPGPEYVPLPRFPNVPAVGRTKAAGFNHWFGFPVTTGPLKDGLIEGRSGFLVSPSPERFDPTSGVKGKPDRNVPMAFTCQPETNLASTFARHHSASAVHGQWQFIIAEMLAWLNEIQRGRAPVPVQVIAIEHHLRLVVGLRSGQCGIHVQIF